MAAAHARLETTTYAFRFTLSLILLPLHLIPAVFLPPPALLQTTKAARNWTSLCFLAQTILSTSSFRPTANGGLRAEAAAPLIREPAAATSLTVPTLHLPNSRLLSPPPGSAAGKSLKKNLLLVPTADSAVIEGDVESTVSGVRGPMSSRSSVTTGSSRSSDEYRSSIVSFGSSITDDDSSFGVGGSRRASALSSVSDADHRPGSPGSSGGSARSAAKRSISNMTPGKLRAIASQVTRAIRRKRRESLAIRRETRATRLVAAILAVFILCWLPFFVEAIYRGLAAGVGWEFDAGLHIQLYIAASWLGYCHSCANPLLYTCLNRNFRSTFAKLLGITSYRRRRASSAPSHRDDVFSDDEPQFS